VRARRREKGTAAARESPCGVVVRRRLCLRNPFRESAERGTQTSEWGKNSVSLPVLHPFSLARPLLMPAFHLSLSLSLSLSFSRFRFPSALPVRSLSFSFWSSSLFPRYPLREPLFSGSPFSLSLFLSRAALARFSVTRQPSRT